MAAVSVAGYSVPKEQRIGYRITPAPGRLMSLEGIGGQMVALSKLLKAVAREEEPETRWNVLILNLTTHESGEVEFEVAIMPKVPTPTPEEGRTAPGGP